MIYPLSSLIKLPLLSVSRMGRDAVSFAHSGRSAFLPNADIHDRQRMGFLHQAIPRFPRLRA